ncbi:hypothetical protein HGA92_03800 [Candidatus Gracilibacteria bacterium]|nr:hypothetical protein [Candidatus Gracilibacteria bacterium]NUJ99222.1 hypothetical protein [Candidatus Gracilibacteria bacterium]
MNEELISTPAMKQYYEIKNEYKDCILFFRMGDFYEMFDDDAHIAHNVLGIAITTRNKNASSPTPLAGIPYHAKEKYLPLLIGAGYKVAIAEQVSDPKLKGIVKREVVRVITPATLHLEGEEYENNMSTSFSVAIVEENGKYGVSFLDLTNNYWFCSEFTNFDTMSSEIYKISPKEVILEKNLFEDTNVRNLFVKKFNLNIYYFESTKEAKQKLCSHFGVKNLEGFGIEQKFIAQKASSLLLEYLEGNQKSSIDFLDKIHFESFSHFLEMDESTLKNLDIIYNFSTKSKTLGTLFGIINETKTSAGSRFLHHSLVKPLKNKKEIEKRQIFIEEFLKNKILLQQVQERLKYISDIDSIMTRLALGRSNCRDLLHLKKSLQMINEIFELVEKSGTETLKEILLK